MANLANVVQQLKKERNQAQHRVEQLDAALNALSGVDALHVTTTRHGRAQAAGAKPRTVSVAVRKRIAAAQRARWAKWKAAQKKK